MGFLRAPPVTILGQSAVSVPHTGDTAEATLATVTIPAGSMGLNGRIEISALFSYTNSANNKFPRVRFGGTLIRGFTATTTNSVDVVVHVTNRNAANSQVVPASNSVPNTAVPTAVTTMAIDTTADVAITLTGALATSSETITLESYSVKLFR